MQPFMHICPAPLHALITLLLVLAYSMLVTAGSSASGYRVELIHVDANGGFSREELMHRAMHRSRLRAMAMDGTGPADISKYTARLGATYGAHEYHVNIAVGTPAPCQETIRAVADTGSDLTWARVRHCMTARSSASLLSCQNSSCRHTSSCWNNLCTYNIQYGRRSNADDRCPSKDTTEGFMVEDTITLVSDDKDKSTSRPVPVPVNLGCTTDTSKSFAAVVGLGWGNQSLVSQLGLPKFSYCLNKYFQPELKSILMLGTATTHPVPATPATRTRLLRNTKHPSQYYVRLEKISITKEQKSMWSKAVAVGGDQPQDDGNMFVDSGASFTLLEKGVFHEVVAELERGNYGLPPKREEPTNNDRKICYRVKSRADLDMRLPDIVLHFADVKSSDGAQMVLDWNRYMMFDEESSKTCLAINPGNFFVLGNYQQQNMHMTFDLTESNKGTLSFVPVDDCASI